MERAENLQLENAKLIFRNFSGKPSKYNKNGRRTVSIILPSYELAKELSDKGWNVKKREFDDPDADPVYRIDVNIEYGNYPPKIYMITSHNKVLLDEDNVGELDFAEIKNVDAIIRPYTWSVDGKSGVKGYVKTMYVTIEEDKFADKYNFSDSSSMSDEDLPF